ncbi:hypothetical protein ACFQH2_05310 [Natronoarchaeum sp. GCM10025703]|uniref:hypothetical protein n=1 Tax=Natronoarchaeum sp. GCM10025703 TaxID=3252685 RepID=UPI00360A4C39
MRNVTETQQFTDGRGLGLSVLGMTLLIIGGAMLYHSVLPTAGAALLTLAFLCMLAVVVFV